MQILNRQHRLPQRTQLQHPRLILLIQPLLQRRRPRFHLLQSFLTIAQLGVVGEHVVVVGFEEFGLMLLFAIDVCGVGVGDGAEIVVGFGEGFVAHEDVVDVGFVDVEVVGW